MPLPCAGVVDHELRSVQELAGNTAGKLERPAAIRPAHAALPASPVHHVAHDRVSQVSEVHSNLVRATRLERDVQQVSGPPTLSNPSAGHGSPARLDHRHAPPLPGIPADWGIDL